MSVLKRIARTRPAGFSILALFLLFSVFASVSIGSVTIPLSDTVRVLFSREPAGAPGDVSESSRTIITKIRVPRLLLGMLVGAALSLSGLVFQALLRNPLADPYTLGVSAGAAFGAGLAVFLTSLAGAAFNALLPLFAFAGGVSTVFLVYFLARLKGRVQILTIILGGVVVSYLFSSGLVLFMSLLGDRAHEIIFWLMGNLSGYHPFLPWNAGLMVALMAFSAYFTRDLDLLALGDDQARSLGVNIELVRLLLFSSTSLLTSLSVSMTGTIGFVGLIVPHTMRLLFGPQHRTLVPASVVAGAAFLPLSDTLARTVPDLLFRSGMEMPVGVVTALVGSPFFIILLIRGKNRSWF